MYPTRVEITPGSWRKVASTPQKQPAAKVALAISMTPFRIAAILFDAASCGKWHDPGRQKVFEPCAPFPVDGTRFSAINCLSGFNPPARLRFRDLGFPRHP